MKRKSKIPKRRIAIIVSISVTFVFVLSLFITNFFIPIIYFTAYVHFKKDINPAGQLRVRYLDVGYGDCILVELPDGKTMLIDGGVGTYGNVYKILDVLNASGINNIDYLFCTSVKSEHCGSLSEILKYKSVGTAYIPRVTNINITDEYASFYKRLLKSGADIQIAEFGKGAHSEEYGYFFTVLSPALDGSRYHVMNSAPTSENINNASAVVWLEYEGNGFMFLSDAGADVQQEIAEMLLLEGGNLNIEGRNVKISDCAVIKAANHCAEDSVSANLYDIIEPDAAIISVGENANSSPSVSEVAGVQLYVDYSIYRTDIHGTITVKVNRRECSISKEKQ